MKQACALARELADLTGETMTGAIYRCPERAPGAGEEAGGMSRKRYIGTSMMAIGERCAKLMGPGPSSV